MKINVPLEEDNTVVENEVDTSELLHHLETDTHQSSSKVGTSMPKATLEAIGP